MCRLLLVRWILAWWLSFRKECKERKLSIFYFNALNLKSDQLLISPYNITPESNIKVMRIKEMISNL